MRMLRIGCLFVCVSVFGGLFGACFSLPECYQDFGTYLNNPNGLPCDKECICNTQLYEGVCLEGVCRSRKREPCEVTGDWKGCTLLRAVDGSSCLSGKQVCNPESFQTLKWPSLWGDCQPLESSAGDENTRERCLDRLDNDCDGKVDAEEEGCKDFCSRGQTKPCYSGPPDTINVGVCARGVQLCDPATNTWRTTCLNQVNPSKEICDGLDNDCDGKVDEDLNQCGCTKAGETQVCYTGPIATTGVGACSSGQRTCQEQGGTLTWGPCQGQTLPTKEECNGKDDNCDGLIDEGCPCNADNTERPCGQSAGECQQGTQSCINGKWSSRCPPQVLPRMEVCDGLDNDCDGAIDEQAQGTSPLARTCQTACGEGVELCKNSQWTGCTAPPVVEEVCDNKDNDCDGDIDEHLTQICRSTCGQEGLEICRKGKWELCSATKSEVEVCDNKDNDCDGLIDEGVAPCVFTVAGTPGKAGATDGTSNQALLNKPYDMVLSPDGAGVLLADSGNHRIRLLAFGTAGGFSNVTTVAGSTKGYKDDLDARKGQLNAPRGIIGPTTPGVYVIADTENHALRFLTTNGSQWALDHFAGSKTGQSGYVNDTKEKTLFNRPTGVFFLKTPTTDPVVVVADQGNHTMRSFNQVQGVFEGPKMPTKGYKDALGEDALFNSLSMVLVDPVSFFFIFLDTGNNSIRYVLPANNGNGDIVQTLAGGDGGKGTAGHKDGAGKDALFRLPEGVAFDRVGNLYIADTGNHCIRKVEISTFQRGAVAYARVSTIAGVPGQSGHADGDPLKAKFNAPVRLFFDPYDDSLYVSDRENHVIRRIVLK